MKIIASKPRTWIRIVEVAVKEFFSESVCLVKKGIGLGVVLFLALTTLSFLNQSTHFLKEFGGARVADVMPPVSDRVVSQVPSNLLAQRPVMTAATVWDRSPNRGVQMNARDTLRESGYFVGELERFTRTLSRLAQ